MRISDWSSDVCSSDLYRSASAKLADQAGEVAHDEVVLRSRIAAELIATLTPEQIQQLKTDRAEREARRAQRKRGPAADDAEIGRAHVRTPVTNAHLVCRLLRETKIYKLTQPNISPLNT